MSEKRKRNIFEKLITSAIVMYRKVLSPLFPPSCIYTPTCSEYAETAIRRYGLVKGCRLAIRRILRCHPFREGGYDPVPDKWENRK